MPLTPRDDSTGEGVKTRAQRAAGASGAEEGISITGVGVQDTRTPEQAPPISHTPTAIPTPDLADILKMLTVMKEQQDRKFEELQRTQDGKFMAIQSSQDRKFEELHRAQQSVQEAVQVGQDALQKQLKDDQQQLLSAVSEVSGAVDKLRNDLDVVEERMSCLSTEMDSVKTDVTELQKKIVRLESSGVATASSSAVGIVRAPSVKVPSYDGTTSWTAYRQQFQTVAAANGWSHDQCLTALTVALRGQALTVLEALPSSGSGYKELLEALESRYGERHLEHVFRAQLRDRVQRPGEGLQQWALEIEKLVRKAYLSADTKMVESNTVQAFVDGIKDLEVRAAVRLRHHASLKEALAHALEVEAVRQDIRPVHKLREVSEEVKEVKTSFKRGSGVMCYRCGEKGHLQLNCPVKSSQMSRIKKLEERMEELTKKRDEASGRVLAGVEEAPSTIISQACTGNNLLILGNINGRDCRMTLDTGASRTIVRPDLVKAAIRNKKGVICRLLSASGQPIPVQGEITVTLHIGDTSYIHDVIVAEIMDDCILGLDFMKKHDCRINVSDGVFKCGDQEIFILGGATGEVTCLRRTTIPGKSEAQVLVKLPSSGRNRASRCVLIEDASFKTAARKCMTARTLVNGSTTAVVRVLNLDSREIKLDKGDVVGQCEEVVWMRKCTATPSSETTTTKSDSAVNNLLEDCKGNLTYSQSIKAKKLLQRFAKIFSDQEGGLGRTSLVQHKIDTGDERPIRQRARRLPIAKEKEVDDLLEEMKRNKIIEPSASPWCSPVVLVKKKDGSTRFCVDYRRLNDITKKDSYPLPRIDDTLDTLSGMKWFSTLDLKSGYWQVEIHPKDKEKTAFSTGKGLWQFNVMPFGLCNAPATFERLMECVLAGLVGDACLVYLDDVIIVGRDFEDHLQKLEQVFSKIQGANLKLNPKKCHLFRNEVDYLGHVISSEGVRTDPRKVEAVQKWPTPKDKTEVRAFLGLCSYYRRFVKGFSDIAKPLHRLTEEKRPFCWDKTCECSFEELKKHLCETPILGYPQPEGQFIVDTDASNTAIGGVLSQNQGDREVVIAYFSKSLSRPERNYCVTRRELLAVVKVLQHFSKYLLGRRFLLRTDHAALKWLLQFKNPEGQVARWIEQLQEYDFETLHRSGKSHGNADALSRRPCPEDCKHCVKQESNGLTVKRTSVAPLGSWEDDAMKKAQKDDHDLQDLIAWKIRGDVKPTWSDVSSASAITKAYWAQWDSLVLQNGILYRKWEKTNGREFHLQIVVPKAKVPDVLREVHDGVSGGHLGVKRTLIKVRERFYWLHCRQDVQDWCRKCTTCAAVKGPQTRSRGTLRLYNVGAPWERIAVDVAGPFPVSESGNKYFMVVMDYFTKWPEVFAIPNQEATTVATKLVEEVICRFGVPLEIHSDQGRNFESQIFQEVCRILGLHKTRTTAYHPQSDGMVERFNQTLERNLAKLVDAHQRDWDKYIPLFLLAYRSAEHETTKATPAFVNFGRELRIPVDLLTGAPPDEPQAITDYVSSLRERMWEIHALVRESGMQASENMKTRYDRRANSSGFEEGALVWLHNPTRRKGKSPKLQTKWEGPYKVITRMNDVTYRIQRQPRGAYKIVHIDRLAKFRGSNNDVRDEHL